MAEENLKAVSPQEAIEQAAPIIKIKYNKYGLIYNANVINNNFLADAQMNQYLANQTTLNILDLVLLNNYYWSLSFIIGLIAIIVWKKLLLKKKTFVKHKLEFEYYLVEIIVTSLIVFGYFFNNWWFGFFLAWVFFLWLLWVQRKAIFAFFEQVFYRKKVNIALDTSLEEEFEHMTVSKLKDAELKNLQLDTYTRSSNAIINTINLKYFNLFGIKILDWINMMLWIALMISLIYIWYFVIIAYNAGLLAWYIK